MYKAELNINGKKEIHKKEKLLTIGIITKNECEKLERCLKSLMPIKEALDCEIIVTDTGSTDNTVAMASKYADKLINFEWVGDFSAARNTGIKEAKGLWFMWIDSDEWLKETEPLIKFFQKNEYKKYFSVTMNLMDYLEDGFLKKSVFRLVLLTKNSIFKNRVHELMPRYEPIKYIDMNIYHDGYSFQSFEARLEKHKRNMELLLNSYEENKSDLRTIEYIVNQYRFYQQYKEAIEYCDKGLKELQKKSLNSEQKAYKLQLYIMKAECCLRLKLYNEVLELLEGLEDNDVKNARRFLDINYVLSETFEEIGQEIKSEEYAKQYIDNYIARDSMDMTYADVFLDISNRKDILKKMLCKCLKFVGNKEQYVSKIKELMLSGKGILNEADFIELALYAANYAKYYEVFSQLYSEIWENRLNFDVKEFENIAKEYIRLNEKNGLDILKSFEKLPIESEFTILAKLITYDLEDKKEDVKNIVFKIAAQAEDKIDSQSVVEVLYGIFKYKLELESIVDKIDIYLLKANFSKALRKHDDLAGYILEYYEKKNIKENIRELYIIVSLLEACLETETVDKNDILKIYNLYQEALPIIMKSVYNENISVAENIDICPPVLRFGYFIDKANGYKQSKEMTLYVRYLKQAVRNYPLMEAAIKHELEKIENDIELESKRNAEFEQLSFNIKQKIYELITLGQKEEALSVIYQLQSIMPDDKELKELKSRLC